MLLVCDRLERRRRRRSSAPCRDHRHALTVAACWRSVLRQQIARRSSPKRCERVEGDLRASIRGMLPAKGGDAARPERGPAARGRRSPRRQRLRQDGRHDALVRSPGGGGAVLRSRCAPGISCAQGGAVPSGEPGTWPRAPTPTPTRSGRLRRGAEASPGDLEYATGSGRVGVGRSEGIKDPFTAVAGSTGSARRSRSPLPRADAAVSRTRRRGARDADRSTSAAARHRPSRSGRQRVSSRRCDKPRRHVGKRRRLRAGNDGARARRPCSAIAGWARRRAGGLAPSDLEAT